MAKTPSRGHVHVDPPPASGSLLSFLPGPKLTPAHPSLDSCQQQTSAQLRLSEEIISVSLEVICRDIIPIIVMQIICGGTRRAVASAK